MQKAIKFLINAHNKKLWPIAILCGALFGLFYQSIVIGGTRDQFKEFGETIEITQKITVIPINIPVKDTYLLKLKGGLKENNQPDKVFINGHFLKEYESERKQIRGIKYRIIPADLIHKGKNQLKICCPGDHFPFRLRIICRNYRKALNYKNIFLLFDSSRYLSKIYEAHSIFTKMLFGILFLCGLWIVISTGWIRILHLSDRKIYLYGLISFISCLLILSVYYLASIYSPYHIILSSLYFWSFNIILIGILNISLISYNFWREYRKGNRLFRSAILNQNLIKSVEWMKSRELSDKLILSFMALLVVCAFWLILGAEPVAEFLANLAYLSLVLGVFIKLFKLFKEGRTKGGESSKQD